MGYKRVLHISELQTYHRIAPVNKCQAVLAVLLDDV